MQRNNLTLPSPMAGVLLLQGPPSPAVCLVWGLVWGGGDREKNNLTSSLFSISTFHHHPHFQKSRSCLEEMGKGLGGESLHWCLVGRGQCHPPWGAEREAASSTRVVFKGAGRPIPAARDDLYLYFTWIFLFPPSTALLPYLNASMSFFH